VTSHRAIGPQGVTCHRADAALTEPLGTLGLAGVTAMDSKTAGLTVRVVLPLTPKTVAMMVEVPVARALARP
jgi:hypothetical protein